MRAKFDLRGLEEYLAAIEAAGRNVDQAAERAVIEGGNVLLNGMRRRAPIRTGALRDFLTRTAPVREGNRVWVEVGIPRRQVAAARGYSPKRAEEISRYGAVQEYGSARTPAHPYIRPAIRQDTAKMRRVQRRVLEEEGAL